MIVTLLLSPQVIPRFIRLPELFVLREKVSQTYQLNLPLACFCLLGYTH